MIPVHVGGLLLDPGAIEKWARAHGLWVVEDAAHAFPAAWRPDADSPWQRCGEGTVGRHLFLLLCQQDDHDRRGRHGGDRGRGARRPDADHVAPRAVARRLGALLGRARWDYRIVAPGFKYNLTDIAAAIGLHQLERAEEMRCAREAVAHRYRQAFEAVEEIELPAEPANRIH